MAKERTGGVWERVKLAFCMICRLPPQTPSSSEGSGLAIVFFHTMRHISDQRIAAEPMHRKRRVPQSASAPGSLQLVSRQNHPRENIAHRQEIRVSGDKRIRFANVGKNEKNLVFPVTTSGKVRPRRGQRHNLGIGKEVAQQILLLLRGKLEFRVGKNSQQVVDRIPANQWPNPLALPGLAYPCQTSRTEYQRGQDNVGIQDDPAHH
jgi:hypothetical protein